MGEYDISNATESDLTSAISDYSINEQSTDGATDLKMTTWMDTDWEQNLGYYKKIPEVAGVIDAKARWSVGKGFEADPETELLLSRIKGFGYDTFNTILENMVRTMEVGGNAYAEIITDEDGILLNLKILDPATMRHHINNLGLIDHFEQVSKVKGKKPKKFKVNEIFYLPRNRIADEAHGNTMIERLAKIILAKNEAMEDYKKIMHWFVKPRWIFHLDTDDTGEINAFKVKMDSANNLGENLYVPKGAVVPELMAISPNATLNPLTWIESLDIKFYEAANVPKIIVGGAGGFTDAAVKIAYLAFQQTIEEKQLEIEQQVLSQLNVEINLIFPASLEQGLLSEQQKEGKPKAVEPNDQKAELEGKK